VIEDISRRYQSSRRYRAASLSALLDEGKRAVTVRVDEARGVAGLAHPGESPYGASFCQRVLQHSNSFAS
jgi:Flp pilus assembly protein RcpC/CpaB